MTAFEIKFLEKLNTVSSESFNLAIKVLSPFQGIDLDFFKKKFSLRTLPSLDQFPNGSHLRLLVDCESSDPKHWLEVGSDLQLHKLGGTTIPVDIISTDLVLSKAKKTALGEQNSISTFDEIIHFLHEQSELYRTLTTQSMQEKKWETHREIIQTKDDIDNAIALLRLFRNENINEIESATQIPSYQCGYYDMHLAVDMGVSDWTKWMECKNDSTYCPLGEAEPDNFDLFFDYVIIRPIKI